MVVGKPREIGSEFHWPGVPQGPLHLWPEPCRMTASGRQALLCIWRHLSSKKSRRLFVPAFFCDEVVSWWERQGVTVRRYVDGPNVMSPDWNTLTPSKGDAVLAVNFFGVRDGGAWEGWKRNNDGVLLIEDHSHDPLSGWAFDSKADYAFASLRKLFPVPDGAIFWSPKGLPLPHEPTMGDWTGSALKLAAMVLKQEYFRTGEIAVKDVFRGLQSEGESMLGGEGASAISPWSRFLLGSGYPIAWRNQRKRNVKRFLDLLPTSSSLQPLFTNWPKMGCPFNAVLLLPSQQDRDRLRHRLIDAGIYPAVHWELTHKAPSDILDLSRKIMTIPVDQRYNVKDIDHVASVICNEVDQ